MWEVRYKSQGVAGGSIWAGIDDTFYWDFVKDDGSIEERTVGYGTWGPIDGWRRKKPEWWGMKKTYSPIRVGEIDKNGNSLTFQVENRQDFSNLNRLEIKWRSGDESGELSANIGPHETGFLEIKTARKLGSNEKLELEFVDPRGFMVDNFILPIHPQLIEYKAPVRDVSQMKVEEADDYLLVTTDNNEYRISTQTGLISTSIFSGPGLMILPMNNGGDTQMHGPTKYYEPFNPVCTEWKLDSIENLFYRKMEIKVYGSYKEAKGVFTYKLNLSGDLSIMYDFELMEDINPRQIGLVFDLPMRFENLAWKRKGYWSTYPDWHIARLNGTAKASEGFNATPVGPRIKPSHEWRHDRTSIGSNDFASTKHNIYRASLRDKTGSGLKVVSRAKIHSRSWIDGESIKWLIASYSNGGSERFLRPHAQKDDIKLSIGDTVKGTVRLQILSNTASNF